MTSSQELVDVALGASAASGCVVVVEDRGSADVRWAGSAMTTNGWSRARTLTAISLREGPGGTRVGIVSRSVQDAEGASAVARAADAASAVAEPLADAAPLMAPYAVADDSAAEVPEAGPDALAPILASLGASFDRGRHDGVMLYGYAEHLRTTTLLATSTGLRRRFDQVDGRFELTGKADGGRRSAWWGEHVTDPATVDVEGALARVGRGLDVARRRTVALPAGRYETLLPPAAVADLMVMAYRYVAQRDAHDGRTAFARPDGGDRIGERLARLPLTLRSDPAFPGLECLPFDVVTAGGSALGSVFDNGQPVTPATWIDRGVLADLARTRSWAAEVGAPPRPPVGNLILDGEGTRSQDEMVAATERGLLLTSLWYVREVDPLTMLLTGLTRDGVYLVEDGAITAAVNNFRFNESPVDLLRRATEAGRSEPTLPRERADAFRRTAMPTLRVPDFLMSSVSDAS